MPKDKVPVLPDADMAQILSEYNAREVRDTGRALDAFAEDTFFEPVRVRRHGVLPEGVTIAQLEEFAVKVLAAAPPERSQVLQGPPTAKKRENKRRVKIGSEGAVKGAAVMNFEDDSD